MTNLPSTGKMTNFETGAVRDAMQGKGLPSHLPTRALRRAAKRFEDGAAKYGAHNWRKGIPLSRYIDGLYRHLWAFIENRTDEDHQGAIIWNAMCLSETTDLITDGLLPEELDDIQEQKMGVYTVERSPIADKQPDSSPIHQSRFWGDMQDHHVFISGPMTGIKDWNHPAFHAAEDLIWDNHQVAGIFNPATIFDGDTSKPRKEYIKRCVEWITQSATAIYMLKGWENSDGARLELATAKEMGCEVFYEQFMVEEEDQ